ncbi:HET-domain-containing protein [Trematosphaeria pertusa]|uniref:HET-domain-containing protein n=1 Tax=Trematosphaeria pertusa TaxID=390896 RepID=A0A6A6I9J5_9PLEO|nr:HET-domain-containing protein [Trematosphaeria pertusa]KAF2246193.1 HET-domain-containing protein [Trematosphaeria pertusa]
MSGFSSGPLRPPWQQSYRVEPFGFRSLAIDPTNQRIVLDLSGLMTGILGVDPSQPIPRAEFEALHARLEQESVDKAKADGKHPNPKLCYMCRRVKPLAPLDASATGSPRFKWNPQPVVLPFGNWSQLRLRQHCSICRLVLSLIITDHDRNNLHPRLAAIDHEIQGVSLHLGETQSSGESVVRVEYGMRHVGELRIVTKNNYTTALRQGWEAKDQNHNFEGFTRRIDAEDSLFSEQVNFELPKSWLNDCALNHGDSCNSNHQRGKRYEEDIPLVLIDVRENCLVTATTSAKYFALSYVWGSVDMSMTLLSNYESRCQKGGLDQHFPNTIADALTLVRALDERYLWIDALCIVQDDTENKMRDLAHMDVIYLRAFATIVALEGSSANAGLPGVMPGTRSPQQVETLVVDAGSKDLDFSSDTDVESAEETRREQATLLLAATPPPLHLALDTSSWDTRGWTFQERMLSRRCLYFTNRSIYFRCGLDRPVLSEGGINDRVQLIHGFSDDPNAPMRTTTSLDNPLAELYYRDISHFNPESRLVMTFYVYRELVEKYTIRKLTYESDIINAFMGIFGALNVAFESDIFCGMPATALDLALLWTPAGRRPRRKKVRIPLEQDIEHRPFLGRSIPTNRGTHEVVWGPTEVQEFDESVDRQFPSWSWVGWVGAAEYRFFAEVAPYEPLPIPLIEEYAINLDGKELQIVSGRKDQVVASLMTLDIAASMANLGLNDREGDDELVTSPSLPNVLQFVASTLPLTAFTISTQREYISAKGHVHSSSRQEVRYVLDHRGNRCGLWWEQAGYVYVGRGVSPAAESKMMLVAISGYGPDEPAGRTGPSRAEGEIELFDERVYPASGLGSGLVNVLAVDLDMGHDFGERITVARIHYRAWKEAGPVMRMVRLA